MFAKWRREVQIFRYRACEFGQTPGILASALFLRTVVGLKPVSRYNETGCIVAEAGSKGHLLTIADTTEGS